MAGYSFGNGLTLDPGAEMQAAAERGKQSKLAQLFGQARNAAPGQSQQFISQANMLDPSATMGFEKAQGGLQEDRMASFAKKASMAAAAWKSGNQQLAQGIYATLVPEAHAIAPGFDLPPQMDDSAAQAFEQLSQGAGGMVQSTFVDAQGNRVGIMRDGRTQILGQNAPNNQILDTGNGFVGVNKGNLTAAPVMLGGAPQAPSGMTAMPDGTQANIDPELPANIRADIAANPQKYAGGGDVQGPPMVQGGGGGGGMPPQQLHSAPKPQAPSALQEKIATARQMGATPDQIRQMVVGGGQDAAPTVPGDTSKTGAAYLTTLPQQVASQVKALAEGRMQFPSGTALKSPYWQGMLSAVSQFDPNFDAVNYNARSNTRKAFTSGKEAQTVNALNTVAEHLGKFSDNAAALGNFSHLGPLTQVVNRAKNAFAEASGDPEISAFNTNKKAVADEVAKVWRATGGSEADIQENLKNLDGAQSPEQLNAAIGTLTQLIYGKVAALQDQYQSGMGTTQAPRPLVSPNAQAAFDKTLRRMHDNAAPSVGPKVIRYDAQGNRIP